MGRALSCSVERGPRDERGQRRRHARPTAAADQHRARRPPRALDGRGLFAVQRRPLRVRHGVDGRQRQMRQLLDGHALRTRAVQYTSEKTRRPFVCAQLQRGWSHWNPALAVRGPGRRSRRFPASWSVNEPPRFPRPFFRTWGRRLFGVCVLGHAPQRWPGVDRPPVMFYGPPRCTVKIRGLCCTCV